jgi:hypothetical protein
VKNSLLKQLFSKEMDRRQFLGHLGAATVVITGLPMLLNKLVEFGGQPKNSDSSPSKSYGKN